MMSQTSQAQAFGPDFKKMAVDFDRFMGLVEPVGDVIINNLTDIHEDSNILDIACGTGEPGITLARSRSDLKILGIDAVDKMISIATTKSQKENLSNIKFEVMQSEHLRFENENFDCVISRFGLGMFGDTVQSINEAVRVLKPNGQFCLAVWHDMSKNTLVKLIVEELKRALKAELPEELAKMFEKSPGADAVQNFKNAGCTKIEKEEFNWVYNFDSANHLREFLKGPATMMFGKVLDKLSLIEAQSIMDGVFEQYSSFQKEDGSYAIPHTCLLVSGHK